MRKHVKTDLSRQDKPIEQKKSVSRGLFLGRKKRKRKRFIGIVAATFVAVTILLCLTIRIGFFSEQEESRLDLVSEAEKETAWETLSFQNAAGLSYEMKINPAVPAVPYKKEDFSLSDEGILTYNGTEYTCLQGVDVSEFQGEIDWKKVKDAGISFAFLRIGNRGYTEGKLKKDAAFEENYKGAQEAGLKVGVYFFSQAVNITEAREEARYVLEWLDHRELALPIVYDPERILQDYARTDQVSGDGFTQNALAFFDIIEKAGYKPAIYSNMYWEAFEWNLEELSAIPIWYADYLGDLQTPYDFTWWQYTASGSVPGITGKVDRNIWLVRNG